MQWSLILLFLMGQSCLTDSQLYEYHYINEEKNWTEAQQHCRGKHTDLATVTNMSDMKRLLSASGGNIRDAWIGLYDQTDGTRSWYWSLPGVEFNESETNWSDGEPTDKGKQGTENCGCLNENLKWVDTGCQNQFYFLCYDGGKTSHKYHLIKEQKTFQKAQHYCRENHTDLVSGWKQLQDGGLRTVRDSTNNKVYFGLFRDTWRWSDGSRFSFRYWADYLNNQEPNSGRCVVTGFNEKATWKTDSCDVKKPFVCYGADKVILIKEKMNWEDALNYCRHHHHDLVTITNQDEQRWVQEKAKNASTDYVWMGLHYACTLDLWFWVSDRLVRYENWASDRPMDDCDMSGAMETRGGHQWRKKNDSERFNFICSKN